MFLELMVSIFLSATAFIGAVWLMYSSKARARLADNQGKVVALFMVIVVVGVVLIFSSYNGILLAPLQVVGLFRFQSTDCPFNRDNCFYGIMFDAGSTGSRIHVYQFRPGSNDQPYELMDELFKYNNKGLSTFAKTPKEGALSLKSMLDDAKEYIPASQWAVTPMALKATAGLRLLDKEDAQNILDEVTALFKSYPFELHDNAVAIMEGSDEGIFSWYTLNFLKRALGDTSKMMGVLDLGGGSTQITFVPLTEETKKAAPEGYLTKIRQPSGESIDLYSHSYLGLGLMSGRFQMVGGLEDPNNNDEVNPDSFTSVCLQSKYTDKMKYNGKEYNIQGKEVDGSRYQACYEMAKTFLPKYNVQKPKEIFTVPFVTISYYYDRAVDSSLIEEEQGGDITLGDFITVAEKECSRHNEKKPYLCLDLTYITALLKEGFGMDKYTTIVLRKKINNIEITWGLGAIIELFNKYGIPNFQNSPEQVVRSGTSIHSRGNITNDKLSLIISDSMCADMHPAAETNVIVSAHPGYKIDELRPLLPSLEIRKYECVLIVVGTNDLIPKSVFKEYKKQTQIGVAREDVVLPPHKKKSVSDMRADYENLINDLKKYMKPLATLLMSAIVPRPYDFYINNDHVVNVNNELKQICKEKNCHYVDTYSNAMFNGEPRWDLFSTDGLHANEMGVHVMETLFISLLHNCTASKT